MADDQPEQGKPPAPKKPSKKKAVKPRKRDKKKVTLSHTSSRNSRNVTPEPPAAGPAQERAPYSVSNKPAQGTDKPHTDTAKPLAPAPKSQALQVIERKERFCMEWIKDQNGAKAAVRAGYSERSARTTASRLLADVNIQTRIAVLIESAVQRLPNALELQADIDTTIQHLAGVAHSNVMDYFDLDPKTKRPMLNLEKATRAQTAGISKIKIKQLEPVLRSDGVEIFPQEVTQIEIALWDKNKGLENMMRYQGLLKDRPVEINLAFIDKMIVVITRELQARGVDADVILEDLRKQAAAALPPPAIAGIMGKK